MLEPLTAHREAPGNCLERLDSILAAVSARRRGIAVQLSVPRQPDHAAVAHFLTTMVGARKVWQQAGVMLNVWQVAGLARDEVRTTKVLAWALDHSGSHGCGNAILANVLAIAQSRGVYPSLNQVDLSSPYAVYAEHCAFADMANRLDVALVARNAVIIIEAKIDAVEGPGQLQRYEQIARAKAAARGIDAWHVVFLTCRRTAVSEHIISLTWKDIAQAIANAIRGTGDRRRFGCVALQQFADHCASLA